MNASTLRLRCEDSGRELLIRLLGPLASMPPDARLRAVVQALSLVASVSDATPEGLALPDDGASAE